MPNATPTKSRSGSRAPTNPKTKAQRLTRVQELTERIEARLADVEALGDERNRIVGDLRSKDGATFKEIGDACGVSEQAIHKAFHKDRQ
jgi:DNA-directed RNA polymerase specialized sigma subunit